MLANPVMTPTIPVPPIPPSPKTGFLTPTAIPVPPMPPSPPSLPLRPLLATRMPVPPIPEPVDMGLTNDACVAQMVSARGRSVVAVGVITQDGSVKVNARSVINGVLNTGRCTARPCRNPRVTARWFLIRCVIVRFLRRFCLGLLWQSRFRVKVNAKCHTMLFDFLIIIWRCAI